MVESSKPRPKTQQSQAQAEMAELQSEYARKKKRYVANQEDEIQGIKEHYNSRKDQTIKQGEAVVNHIKKAQDENIANAYEGRKIMQNRGQKQMNQIEEVYQKKVADMSQERGEALNEFKERTHKEVAKVHQHQEKQIDTTQTRAKTELENMKNRYRTERDKYQTETQRNMESLQRTNESQIQSERENGKRAYTQTQKTNEANLKEVTEHGQKSITEASESQKMRSQRLQDESKKDFEKKQKHWTQKDAQLNETYSKHLNQNKQRYQKDLKSQNNTFQSMYNKTTEAQKASLQVQKDLYTRQLTDDKKEFLTEDTRYAEQKDDPFYKIQNRGNHFEESSDHYVLRAFVPNHEKDKVKVVIDKDKAVVAGQRSFQEKIDDENSKLQSQSYQSFREEFALPEPVVKEGVVRERDGDFIVFTIPKASSLRKG
ncbi:MAG: Hsp20 family protein [Bdellovibrionota bacterium]